MFDVRDKPEVVERAFLVGVFQRQQNEDEAEDLLTELHELVQTLGIGIVGDTLIKVPQWQSRLLMGSGKADDILEMANEAGADCIVFDNELTPAQQRNWEALSKLCVIDRQEVILDIFGQRAQTKEAKLQVNLARMEYNLPRLKRAWSHLGRQGGAGAGGGGGGAARGEGEMQIELDRRIVREKIESLKADLAIVRKQRATQRKERNRTPVPHAAVVGYTNAGKSSLVRKLSGSEVYVANKLFATLDTTTRKIRLPNGWPLLITDTVGFVRRLPHRLVESFKATLEEAVLADFLIHVLDVSAPQVEEFYDTTLKVLHELGAEQKQILTVFNKVDLIEDKAALAALKLRHPDAVFVSAHHGTGLNDLEDRMADLLADQVTFMQLNIPHTRADIVNQLHEHAHVASIDYEEAGVAVHATVPNRLVRQLEVFRV